MSLSLPAVLTKNGNQRTAHTADDYWKLFYEGFKPDEGAEPEEVGLSRGQKAARTRAINKAAAEEKNPSNQSGGTIDNSQEHADVPVGTNAGDVVAGEPESDES